MRADHLRFRVDRGASADRRERAWMPGLLALSLSIVIALVLIARPTHELPPLPPVVAVYPPAPVEAPAVERASVEMAPEEDELPAATPDSEIVQPPAPAPKRLTTVRATSRPVRVHRPAFVHASSRVRWSEPSALARAATRVAWAPYRTILPRENTQSP